MDGSAPAAPALPPLSQPAPAIYRPSSPPPPPSQIPNPVGRPSADPEQQAQRVERSAEMKRIESVLPKSIDSKVLVFKSRDGRILPSAKPFMTVLVSELEEAKRNDSDMDSETFVAAKLAERGIQDGKFACRFVDKTGKIIPNTQFEVAIGGDEDDMNDPNGGFEDDGEGAGMPVFQAPPQAGYQTPPAPPALDADSYMRISRTERNDEAKRGADLAALIAGQQQSTTQLMMQLQQQQRDAQELARRDAADREERAEKRRAEFKQTLLTIIPLVLPLIQGFFKKDHGPDATQTMMMELFKAKLNEKPEKGVDAMMLETVMKTMGAMTTQQMAAMQQGTVLTAQMQGEATGLIFKNLMGSMKELMDSKKDSEPKEESTFQQVLKVAAPLLASFQQQQGPAPGPSADQLAPPVPTAQVVHTEVDQPRRRREKVPPPAATQPAPDSQQQPAPAAPKRHTDLQLINGSLMTIARLSVGEILPIQRFNALNWIRDNAPASLLDAVRAGDEGKVLEIGAPAVMSSAALQGWINVQENVDFLRAALADLRHVLNGTLTKEIEENSIIAQAEFTTKRKQTVAAERAQHGPPVAQVVNEDGTPMTAHPAATTPATQTAPADEKPTEKPAETAAAGTTPAPTAAKKPGRRIRKAMPPAAPAADAQPGA